MGPNFTPLSSSHAPPSPSGHKRRFDKKIFALLSVLILFTGIVSGYLVVSSGIFFRPQAHGDTTYYSKNTGQSLSYDGRYVTVHDKRGAEPLKLVNYRANQPYWGQKWMALGPPSVHNVSDGSRVEVPCGFFQSDLIPRDHTVYDSPSYNGDRYGNPGDNVLMAAVNGTRKCSSTPTPVPPTATPRPPTPTSTPKPSPTPTRVPVCGSNCTSDSQCPTGLKCYNKSYGSHSSPTGKCVLAKCLDEGVVCSSDKCTVIPPTATPTPPPTATIACPKPNPVKNLRINCPICKQT